MDLEKWLMLIMAMLDLGKEKITLYRGKEVVKRSVHFNDGVDD